MMFHMRTTLTIDDDVAAILQKKSRQEGHSFKEVVNDVLRAGLAAGGEKPARRKRIKVVGWPLGLRPGIDPTKLNQLVDELEVEEFLRKRANDNA